MRERRKFDRSRTELHGYNLYRNGDWLPMPQSTIRQALLRRWKKGLWIPSYPARDSVELGEDVWIDILLASKGLLTD